MNRAWAALACLLAGGCGQSERIVGNGSETTSGLSARILDDQGEPVSGARIEVRPASWTPAEGEGFDPVRRATSDVRGVARLETLPAGDWRVIALRGATGASSWMGRQSSTVESRLDLRMAPLVSVRGVVDPAGAAGGWVAVEGMDRMVRTDSTGIFRIDSLPGAPSVLRFGTDRGRRGSVGVRLSTAAEVDLGTLRTRDRGSDLVRTDSVEILVDLGAARTDTLVGYPLLVRLTDTALDFARTRGTDLSFHRGGRALAHEVEEWNSSARQAAVWVRIDTLLPTDRTLNLVLAFGGAEVPDWGSSTEVFPQGEGWRGVWHLDAGDPGREATGAHRALDWRTLEAPGAIGTGRFCDTGWLRVPDAPTLRPRSLTVSAWVLPRGEQIVVGKFVSKGNQRDWRNSWSLQYFDASFRPGFLSVRTDSVPDTLHGDLRLADGVWSLVAATWDESSGRQVLYVDGQAVDSSGPGRPPEDPNPLGADLDVFLGANFIGVLDEARLAGVARSATWIALDHHLQRPLSPAVRFLRNR